MGKAGSAKWIAMLDAAEDVLREEGFRALTSRRVADRLGFKQRLVYYYFETMEDLIVETFRRLSTRELERLHAAAASKNGLREIWDASVHTMNPKLISEFMALAYRIDGLRREVTHFIRESRRIQVEVITETLAARPKLTQIRPQALAILASSVALNIQRERDLGVELGHAGVIELIAEFLDRSGAEAAGAKSM